MTEQQQYGSNHSLDPEEQKQLNESIRRAQQFEKAEDLDLMRQPLEGYLLKFTNAFQGWQHRWFVLDPNRGELRYYLKQDHSNTQKPRGVLSLAKAHVTPNEEDSLSFTVHPQNQEQGYRLKAADTKLKQEWINRLRTVAEDHRKILKDGSSMPARTPTTHESVRRGTAKEGALFHNLHKILSVAVEQQHCLSRAVDVLPVSRDGCLDANVLMLRSDANAVLTSLDQCLQVLKDIQAIGTFTGQEESTEDNDSGSTYKFYLPSTTVANESNIPANASLGQDALASTLLATSPKAKTDNSLITQYLNTFSTVDDYNEQDETQIESNPSYNDMDVGSVESEKSLILNLLSHLKLGTDLTKVPLPTFVLQSRSLLETYSDFFANASLLLNVPDLPTAESRMVGVLKWFLTSFNFGCKSGLARKPYNPVLGEIFRCSWLPNDNNKYKLRFVGEQVSHHPPVSAFFVYCPEKGIYLNSYVWPKSKFLGTSLSATMVGQAKLVLTNVKSESDPEIYTFSFPTCFARSILTTPWFELGGKLLITSNRSDVQASVVFHTKPFYGGKLHHVTAEVKKNVSSNGSNVKVTCKVTGEWNKGLEFVYEDGSMEVIDVPALDWAKRAIRPLDKQIRRESRVLWHRATDNLRKGNLEEASKEKSKIEEAQRSHVKYLQKQNHSYSSAFFNATKNGGWVHQKMPDIAS